MITHKSEQNAEVKKYHWTEAGGISFSPRNGGGEKVPCFSQCPPLILWQLWELHAFKVARSLGTYNRLHLRFAQKHQRRYFRLPGTAAHGECSTWHRCVYLMAQKRRKTVLSKMFRFEEEGFVYPQDYFLHIAALNCSGDGFIMLRKDRTVWHWLALRTQLRFQHTASTSVVLSSRRL